MWETDYWGKKQKYKEKKERKKFLAGFLLHHLSCIHWKVSGDGDQNQELFVFTSWDFRASPMNQQETYKLLQYVLDLIWYLCIYYTWELSAKSFCKSSCDMWRLGTENV